MLLAEELAPAAIRPGLRAPQMGVRRPLNACLAGLLVAELVIRDAAAAAAA